MYNIIVPLSMFILKNILKTVTLIENTVFVGFIRWDHTGVGRALNSVWLVSLQKGEIWTDTYIGRISTWRRWERLEFCFYWYKPRTTKDYQPSPKTKGETGTEEITPAENWIQDFGLQNCDTGNFCCLSHLVHSSLLRQP